MNTRMNHKQFELLLAALLALGQSAAECSAQVRPLRPGRVWKLKGSDLRLRFSGDSLVVEGKEGPRETIPLSAITALAFDADGEHPVLAEMKRTPGEFRDEAFESGDPIALTMMPAVVAASEALMVPFLWVKTTRRHYACIAWKEGDQTRTEWFRLGKSDARSLLEELRRATGHEWENRANLSWRARGAGRQVRISGDSLVYVTRDGKAQSIPLTAITSIAYEKTSRRPFREGMKTLPNQVLAQSDDARALPAALMYIAAAWMIQAPLIKVKTWQHNVQISWIGSHDGGSETYSLNKKDAQALLTELHKATGLTPTELNFDEMLEAERDRLVRIRFSQSVAAGNTYFSPGTYYAALFENNPSAGNLLFFFSENATRDNLIATVPVRISPRVADASADPVIVKDSDGSLRLAQVNIRSKTIALPGPPADPLSPLR